MRRLRSFVSPIVYDLPTGTLAIATGLSILAVAMIFPGSPAVTGMALVVLGATCATRARFRGNTAILSIMLVHLFTYGSLYVLFVGSASTRVLARAPPWRPSTGSTSLSASVRWRLRWSKCGANCTPAARPSSVFATSCFSRPMGRRDRLILPPNRRNFSGKCGHSFDA